LQQLGSYPCANASQHQVEREVSQLWVPEIGVFEAREGLEGEAHDE
jgi:hypothetical protein